MLSTWIASLYKSPPFTLHAWTAVMDLCFFPNRFLLVLWLCRYFDWLHLLITSIFPLVSGPWVANTYLNSSRLAWTLFHSFVSSNFSKLIFVPFSTLGQLASHIPYCFTNSCWLASPWPRYSPWSCNFTFESPVRFASLSLSSATLSFQLFSHSIDASIHLH
jgi:hypothetical protein